MPSKKPFYITTTLPYVNSDPHIGFAMELVRADVIARYHKLIGKDVFFNTGTDEHGAKIYENAVSKNMDVQKYVDGYAEKFKELIPLLGVSEEINFIRTTDDYHISAAEEMWKRCEANGDIYKKNYKVKYCVGCELEKTESELVDSKCPIHPNREIEIREEENYFFKFSNYQEKLLKFYEENPNFVTPDFRYNEIKAFVSRGLEDFSISRIKEKMPWGVPVPKDDKHVMYVWFDALTSYISALGWPSGEGFDKYWVQKDERIREVIQYCGKDNLRQQSAMWQAMLMSSGLPGSTNIIINGFINSGGQKMSKSVGNVINPFEVIDMFNGVTDYPEDVLRFVLLHEISSFEDGDVTLESIKSAYSSYLQNGIGNLTSRIMKMSVDYAQLAKNIDSGDAIKISLNMEEDFNKCLEDFDIKKSVSILTSWVSELDEKIQKEEAYKVVKEDLDKAWKLIYAQKLQLQIIAEKLAIFMPNTSSKILECIRENKMPEKPLFARINL